MKKPLLTVKTKEGKEVNFFHYHSLSIVTLGILLLWIILYIFSDPTKHAGAFYGNAIADWSGSLVIIIASKYFLERWTARKKPASSGHLGKRLKVFCHYHSLSLFLLITGIFWVIAYLKMDCNSKWGQVVGNIVSEWGQTLGLVLLTKRLIEKGSHQS